VILYDPNGAHASWAAKLSFAKGLQERKLELAVLLPNSLHAVLIVYLAKIPYRVGYAADGRSLLLTHTLAPPQPPPHQLDYYLGLLKALGINGKLSRKPKIFLLDKERAWAKDFLSQHGVDVSGGTPLIAFHPGSSKPGKAWHPERFGELGRRLAQTYGARIILLGGASEAKLLLKVKGIMGEDSSIGAEGTTLRQAAAILSYAWLLVGNDSGMQHVAAALGIPLAAIFGPGSPALTAPVIEDKLRRIVLEEFSCRPCRQKFFRDCQPSPAGKPPCLEAITVRKVEMAVGSLWPSIK